MALTWYPRNMGKYARKTGTLSLTQHGAYNLLLDHYYSTGPIQAFEQCSSNAQLMPDHSPLYRLCTALTKAEQDAVDFVLKRFFTLEQDGCYHNKEADQVIEEQKQKHETRVRVGRENRAKAMLKQSSSNAPQKKKEKENINPPTPQGGRPAAGGFKKRGEGKGGDPDDADRPFNIRRYLTADVIQNAKDRAPGWCVELYLAGIYNENINSGAMERPKNPAAAYPAWCGSYTKGKRP